MTRFARAKGSKASNERLPEQATSWSEMKQQLLEKNKEIEENKKRKEIINQRNANYKAFLEKNEEDKSKNSKWADFPGISQPVQCKKRTEVTHKKRVKNNECIEEQDMSEDDDEFAILKNKVDDILLNIKKLNKVEAKVEADDPSDSDAPPEEESAKKEIVEPSIKVKKHKKKKLLKIIVDKEKSVKEEKSDQKEKSGTIKKKRKAEENAESTKSKKIKTIQQTVPENGEEIIQNNKTKQQKNKKGTDKIKKEKKVIKENLTEKDLKKIEKKKTKKNKASRKEKESKSRIKNTERDWSKH